ncbi:GNAT family N-acetyltransferase [Calothrix sp. CCY 0018]|uniref:GNAT family N-acetyltransferase n=1 Tax=Calothrix sp. CCY 0018 TaxID=3103864 RepID=UPI0039C5B1FB
MLIQENLFKKEKLQIKAVQTVNELGLHIDAWNQLAFAAPQQLPMSSYAWVSSYFEHNLSADESWVCLFAYDEKELVGVMPLVVKSRSLVGFKFFLLGIRRSTQTCSIDVLAKHGQENTVIPAMIDAAIAYYPHQIGFIFDRLPENSPTIDVLENLSGFTLVKEFDSVGAFLKIADSFAEYRSSLSGNFRSNLNKASKKLHKLTDVKISFLNGNKATQEHLTKLIEVEAKSWKKDEGTAISDSAKDMDFFQHLAERLSAAGFLEWQILEAEGKTIAVNFAVRLKRSILIWKLSFDPSYSKCSPGSILLEEAVKLAYESEDIDEINLMTDHSWYDNWKMEKRRYYNLKLYQNKPIPLMIGYFATSIRQKFRSLSSPADH